MNDSDVLRGGPGHNIIEAGHICDWAFSLVVMDHLFRILEPPIVEVEQLTQASANEELYLRGVEGTFKAETRQL